MAAQTLALISMEQDLDGLDSELLVAQPRTRRLPWWVGALPLVVVCIVLLVGALLSPADVHHPAGVPGGPDAFGGIQLLEIEADFESTPFFQEAMRRALELDPPLRELQASPGYVGEALDAMEAECVIDNAQASTYLMQAVVNIYRSTQLCPENPPWGCAASVATVVTSFIWVSSYVSLATSSCAKSLHTTSLCSADWTSVAANFGEIVTSSAAVYGDCNFTQTSTLPSPPPWNATSWGDWTAKWKPGHTKELLATVPSELEDLQDELDHLKAKVDQWPASEPEQHPPADRQEHAAGKDVQGLPAKQQDYLAHMQADVHRRKRMVAEALERQHVEVKQAQKLAIKQHMAAANAKLAGFKDLINNMTTQALASGQTAGNNQRLALNARFSHVQCFVDVVQAASYIVRVILQLRVTGCPAPRACATNLLAAISSFAWISQFLALAVSDCPVVYNQRAACTADVSDMVAGITNLIASAMATEIDCATSAPAAAKAVLRPLTR